MIGLVLLFLTGPITVLENASVEIVEPDEKSESNSNSNGNGNSSRDTSPRALKEKPPRRMPSSSSVRTQLDVPLLSSVEGDGNESDLDL